MAARAVVVIASVALLQQGLADVVTAAAPPPPLRRPASWDMVPEASGSECVRNATSDHNSRLAFWALPAGAPPSGGWPVYLLFQPWMARNSSSFPAGVCGTNSAFPPSSQIHPACTALMRQRCPDNVDRSACEACVRELRQHNQSVYRTAECSPEQTDTLWCRFRGQQQSRLEVQPPFATPGSTQPCLAANGSWSPRQPRTATGTKCGFTSVNGHLWAQLAAGQTSAILLHPLSL